MYLLGIDIGTSSTKSAIFTADGEMAGLASRAYTFEVARPGYAEQNPEVWWEAAAQSIREAVEKSGVEPREIRAIGLSGQMHGLVGLDAEGRVVRKAILHCDVRAAAEAEELSRRFGTAYSDIVLNPVFPGFQAVSLCWLKKNEPENFQRIRSVICPKDYVRYRLTGKIGVEHTDASGTLFYDNRKCGWSPEIFKCLGFSQALVPAQIHSPFDIAGGVTKQAAERCGLAEGTPVVFGGADQAMQSLGNGVFEEGTMMATIGTSGQVLAVSGRPVVNPALNTHTFRHAEPGVWYTLGAVLYAGSTLSWFRRTFMEGASFEQMSALADTVAPGCSGLVFLPCMGGERTPYLDPKARGVFDGITMLHTKAHFVRAIMEGVAFAMKTSILTVTDLCGRTDRLVCAGGGVNGATWAQIQADVYNREILVSGIREQACLGAAMAAGIGSGAFADVRSGSARMCGREMRKIEPIPGRAEVYERLYRDVYRQVYPQNAGIFQNMDKFK